MAFANSVRPGHVATVLIGERNDGTPEDIDPDVIQKAVRMEIDKIYPQIIWRSSVYEKAGKQCVRVEIEHSGDTPHFGGAAWVRKGSETIPATVQEFQRLIDLRSSLVFELDQWIGKVVTVESRIAFANRTTRLEIEEGVLTLVNRFYVTVTPGNRSLSYPLKALTICWDDNKGRLKLIIERQALAVPI